MMSKVVKLGSVKPGVSIQEIFETIYKENFHQLFLFARSITKSDELAKDIVSDVMIDLWDNKSRLTKIEKIESYLFVSVKNHAIRVVSNNPFSVKSYDLEKVIEEIERINPEEVLLEKELFELIEETVSSLPNQCQLIFRMAKNKQLKYKEIAIELGISTETVKTQLVKAISIIRSRINNHYKDPVNQEYISKSSLATLILLLCVDIANF